MPTSITVAPGLTKSRVIMAARPIAATRMSARRHVPSRSRGIGVNQQHCGGLAHDVATAHDHGFLSRDGDLAALEDFHDPSWRTGNEPGPLRGEKSDVDGMEAVNVFGGIDRHQNFLCIYPRG